MYHRTLDPSYQIIHTKNKVHRRRAIDICKGRCQALAKVMEDIPGQERNYCYSIGLEVQWVLQRLARILDFRRVQDSNHNWDLCGTPMRLCEDK